MRLYKLPDVCLIVFSLVCCSCRICPILESGDLFSYFIYSFFILIIPQVTLRTFVSDDGK